jgi:hypothetical protein
MTGVRRSVAGVTASAGAVSTRGAVKDAAELIAADARVIAGRWSRRIPPSIRVTVAGDGKSATITAGGPEAPMAITFEDPGGGAWRNHPVFARGASRREWTWVAQAPRPFLAAAADRQATKAADLIGDGFVTAWARSRGFSSR